MTSGERTLWASVYAASYIAATANVLLSDQAAREHAVKFAACVAGDALAGLRAAVLTDALPDAVHDQANVVLYGVPR